MSIFAEIYHHLLRYDNYYCNRLQGSQGMWLNRLAAGETLIVRSREHGDMQLTAKPVKAKKSKATKPKRDIWENTQK